uniref:Uncharacterized protein n=1 Tax=Solanum lycopersicum TaxID=4081 RepID=A0A3Q7G343_SOLLC
MASTSIYLSHDRKVEQQQSFQKFSALAFYASVIFKSNSWTSNCLGQVAGQISGEFTEVAIPFQRHYEWFVPMSLKPQEVFDMGEDNNVQFESSMQIETIDLALIENHFAQCPGKPLLIPTLPAKDHWLAHAITTNVVGTKAKFIVVN